MSKRVLVAMSGGVDSSVAAYLLKQEGYVVSGVTMCLGISDAEDDTTRCCGADAINDAKSVCKHIGVSHSVLDFSPDMEQVVIENFVSEYVQGRTPNPCVRCNEYLKFGKLLTYAQKMGFDFLATGHYAKIEEEGGVFLLRRPKDRKKDQTYFLYCIKKEQLPFILFPLAGYTKEEVRRIAKKAELPVAAKPQSQDICFISGNGYKDFIRARVGEVPGGDIVTINGTVVGQHDGIIQYTRGQRGGLRVALGKPQYVVAVDAEHNRIVIGDKKDLRTRTLIARDINRLVDAFPQTVCAKIRYSHTEASCTVRLRDNGSAAVEFEEAQEAITPGQAVVFYDGDTVLGGGSID